METSDKILREENWHVALTQIAMTSSGTVAASRKWPNIPNVKESIANRGFCHQQPCVSGLKARHSPMQGTDVWLANPLAERGKGVWGWVAAEAMVSDDRGVSRVGIKRRQALTPADCDKLGSDSIVPGQLLRKLHTNANSQTLDIP